MSTTSKSPRKVLLAAYKVGQRSLPQFSHRFSPKTFTLSQLFACLVLKSFLKSDYRGVVEFLADCPELCRTIELKKVPHFTTLQKAGDVHTGREAPDCSQTPSTCRKPSCIMTSGQSKKVMVLRRDQRMAGNWQSLIQRLR